MRHAHARWILRSVPSLLALGLLAFALLGATDPNAPRAVPDALVYPNCTYVLESVTPESTLTLVYDDVVVQPFATEANMAACSLAVLVPAYTRSNGTLSVVAWDPVASAPEASSAALRSLAFSISTYTSWPLLRLDLVPPLVRKHVQGIAEAPPSAYALKLGNLASGWLSLGWSQSAAGTLPRALRSTGGGPLQPIGANGVTAHRVCGGDGALQQLMVVQSVVRKDSLLAAGAGIVAQRFRVPTRTLVNWVELVFGPNPFSVGDVGTISILDAQGQATPPMWPTTTLASAGFAGRILEDLWASHVDFDTAPVLVPNHDYWIWVHIASSYALGVRTLDGNESADYHAGVGECLRMSDAGPPWTPEPRHTLDFKIVGLPLDLVSPPPPAPPVAPTFTLRASPNPTRGSVTLAWSGASGALAFEVLDERGRRVARGDADAAPQGTWRFEGRRADGRPLPAGVYFVRASDGDGRLASERVVLLR